MCDKDIKEVKLRKELADIHIRKLICDEAYIKAQRDLEIYTHNKLRADELRLEYVNTKKIRSNLC